MINLVNTEVLEKYIDSNHNGAGFAMGMDRFLGNWEKAKQEHLFKMMGGELILEKEIKIEKSKDLMIREMSDFCYRFSSDVSTFIYQEYISKEYSPEAVERAEAGRKLRRLIQWLTHPGEELVENRVKNEYEKVKFNDKTIAISKGQKVMRAIGTVLKAINYNHMELFEEFKIKHSMVLNDKMLSGTFCLSIHPLDYITVSDNNAGWESCLSWMNEGCYRAGTLELVNCPVTVVAYLKSSEDMKVGWNTEETWNSKKWRQLIIADKGNAIISNKAYPYASDPMTKIAMDWVKELLEKNCGYEFLDEMIGYDEQDEIAVRTNKVYNDLDGNSANGKMYLGSNSEEYSSIVKMGGEAYCLQCGGTYDNEARLHCQECNGEFYCDCCGDMESGDSFITQNGDTICYHCYDNDFFNCDCCGDVVRDYDRNSDPTGVYDYVCANCRRDIDKKIEDSKTDGIKGQERQIREAAEQYRKEQSKLFARAEAEARALAEERRAEFLANFPDITW